MLIFRENDLVPFLSVMHRLNRKNRQGGVHANITPSILPLSVKIEFD